MISRVPAPDGEKNNEGLPLMVLPEGTILKETYETSYLSRGGMSIAYRAETDSGTYFLKEVSSDDSRKVVSLSQEKVLLELLDHPGIVKAYDFFEQEGFYYLVMEFIQGKSLDKLISRSSSQFIDEKEIFLWAWQLYEIFEYLHAQKPPIIYRDLKPQNVIRDDAGRVHLVDFGIARLYKNHKIKDTISMGTILTASPEHYGGKQTDERSDIYTIGATLHYLLTNGRDQGESIFEFAPIRPLNPGVTEELEKFIFKAVEVYPDDRYKSIVEMRKAHLFTFQNRIDEFFSGVFSTKELGEMSAIVKDMPSLNESIKAIKEKKPELPETNPKPKEEKTLSTGTSLPPAPSDSGQDNKSQKASAIKSGFVFSASTLGLILLSAMIIITGIFMINRIMKPYDTASSSKSPASSPAAKTIKLSQPVTPDSMKSPLTGAISGSENNNIAVIKPAEETHGNLNIDNNQIKPVDSRVSTATPSLSHIKGSPSGRTVTLPPPLINNVPYPVNTEKPVIHTTRKNQDNTPLHSTWFTDPERSFKVMIPAAYKESPAGRAGEFKFNRIDSEEKARHFLEVIVSDVNDNPKDEIRMHVERRVSNNKILKILKNERIAYKGNQGHLLEFEYQHSKTFKIFHCIEMLVPGKENNKYFSLIATSPNAVFFKEKFQTEIQEFFSSFTITEGETF